MRFLSLSLCSCLSLCLLPACIGPRVGGGRGHSVPTLHVPAPPHIKVGSVLVPEGVDQAPEWGSRAVSHSGWCEAVPGTYSAIEAEVLTQ